MWVPTVPVETGTHPPGPPPWIPAFAGMTIWVPTVVPVETGTHPRPPACRGNDDVDAHRRSRGDGNPSPGRPPAVDSRLRGNDDCGCPPSFPWRREPIAPSRCRGNDDVDAHRRPRGDGDPSPGPSPPWIPAFAGMTIWVAVDSRRLPIGCVRRSRGDGNPSPPSRRALPWRAHRHDTQRGPSTYHAQCGAWKDNVDGFPDASSAWRRGPIVWYETHPTMEAARPSRNGPSDPSRRPLSDDHLRCAVVPWRRGPIPPGPSPPWILAVAGWRCGSPWIPAAAGNDDGCPPAVHLRLWNPPPLGRGAPPPVVVPAQTGGPKFARITGIRGIPPY